MELEIGGVKFGYGSSEILDGITFRAKQGSILGIIGENGCGKTTLLKCIDCMLRPTSGSIMLLEPDPQIFINDRELTDDRVDISELERKEIAKCMAVVSQSTYINFPYNGYDVVRMGRYAQNDKDRKTEHEAVYNAMRRAGALEFAERPVNELSGGELRRVMIARALAQNPRVLLLDEPTLHLDINHQFDLMDLITELRDEYHMIVILVTHDLTFAARYCDELIMMKKGRIIDAGQTEKILTEESIRDVFHINAVVEYDKRVGGLNVVMIGRNRNVHTDF